jgi:RNA polymerase sigma factor (TIGR02999 family)
MQRSVAVADDCLAADMQAAESGDPQARDRLFKTLYAELYRLAQRELMRGPTVTLSPPTLLHETFLNLSQRDSLAFTNRGQFIVYAGRAMRGLIIDYMRNRQAQKRGGQFEITSFPTIEPAAVPDDIPSPQLERLREALEELLKIDARLAECVDLKFFCGFSFVEIAQFRNVTERTVRRDWTKARLLLQRFLDAERNRWWSES